MKAACSLGDCRGLSFFAACLECLRMKSGCRVLLPLNITMLNITGPTNNQKDVTAFPLIFLHKSAAAVQHCGVQSSCWS
eukprot:1032389-Pelagomonas_calceolata.AAC.1